MTWYSLCQTEPRKWLSTPVVPSRQTVKPSAPPCYWKGSGAHYLRFVREQDTTGLRPSSNQNGPSGHIVLGGPKCR